MQNQANNNNYNNIERPYRASSRTARRLQGEAQTNQGPNPAPNSQQGSQSMPLKHINKLNQTAPPIRAANMTKDKAKPKNKGKSNRKFSLPVPLWMPIVVFVLALSLGGLAIANANMQAFLEDQEAIRIAAHERLLRNHPLEYLDLINQSAEINNIKPGFIAAIILCESSYRRDATSSVNARGLMQLMEDTAGWIAGKLSEGSTYNFDLMYEPEANIRYGTWYLNYLANMFYGDPILVAGAYHAGQGTITNWLANPEYSRDGVSIKLDDMMDGPTKTYIKRVMDAYANYEALYFSQEVSNENQQAS